MCSVYQPACCVHLLHANWPIPAASCCNPCKPQLMSSGLDSLLPLSRTCWVLLGTTLTSSLLQNPQTLPHIISAHLLLIILGYVHTALLLQLPHVATDGIKLPFQRLQTSATVSNVILLPGEVLSLQGAIH